MPSSRISVEAVWLLSLYAFNKVYCIIQAQTKAQNISHSYQVVYIVCIFDDSNRVLPAETLLLRREIRQFQILNGIHTENNLRFHLSQLAYCKPKCAHAVPVFCLG